MPPSSYGPLGMAHWIGGNVDLGLAANILVGSIPGVLIGSQLAVKVPTGLLRNALGLVLIASSITLITKEQVPKAVLIPSISVAAVTIGALFAVQIGLHRQRQRALEKARTRRPRRRGVTPPPPPGNHAAESLGFASVFGGFGRVIGRQVVRAGGGGLGPVAWRQAVVTLLSLLAPTSLH